MRGLGLAFAVIWCAGALLLAGGALANNSEFWIGDAAGNPMSEVSATLNQEFTLSVWMTSDFATKATEVMFGYDTCTSRGSEAVRLDNKINLVSVTNGAVASSFASTFPSAWYGGDYRSLADEVRPGGYDLPMNDISEQGPFTAAKVCDVTLKNVGVTGGQDYYVGLWNARPDATVASTFSTLSGMTDRYRDVDVGDSYNPTFGPGTGWSVRVYNPDTPTTVSIPIPNGSFESPVVSGSVLATPTDWYIYAVPENGSILLHLTDYTGWGITGPAEGQQCAGFVQSIIYDYIPNTSTYQAGWTYRLSCAMGRGEGTGEVDGRIALGARDDGDNPVLPFNENNSMHLADLPLGQWVDVDVWFGPVQPEWVSAVGKRMYVRLTSGSNWMYFDNVRLTAYPPGEGPGSLSGEITLGGYTGDVLQAPIPIRIELMKNGSVLRTQVIRAESNPQLYTMDHIEGGTYDVRFSACKWVRQTVENVVVPNEAMGTKDVVLVNGDANGDNVVNGADTSIVLQGLDQTGD